MTNLPAWVGKVTTLWVAIGSLLVVLGAQGVELPEYLTQIFTQEFVDMFLQVLGSILTFAQFVRAIFAAQPPVEGEIKVLSAGQKRAFALNPFKIKA